MADSTSLKAQKSGEKHKYSNMINRTTSESIRIHDSDKIPNHPTSLSATSTTPRKKTSFQITSVTVGGHTSNDGDCDDSADDLDESHAEDNSDVIDTSRATDLEIETPSYSEDTFSKDDVFFNSSTSMGSAPVIPTSSQYGLAIVSTPEGCSNILNSNVPGGNSSTGNDLHVNVTDNVINLGIVGGKHLEGDMRDLHSHTSRNERFKVVKIESTEPFKRGRWLCMDYLDHTTSQQQQLQNQGSGTGPGTNAVRGIETNDSSNQCPNADSGISVADQTNVISTIDDHNTTDYSTSLGSSSTAQSDQQNLISHSVAVGTGQSSVSPGQTMQFSVQVGNMVQQAMNVSQPQTMQQQAQSMSSVNNQHSMIGTNQHQSLQPQQIQQVLSATNMHSQSTSMGNQQIQQPIQQLQHQGIQIQHVHQIHQPQAPTNIVPQQYQQPPQIQQIHHQAIQQNTQTILQQQSSMSQAQHMQQQSVQHQHNIQLQQQINQGQIPVQVAQTVIQNQNNMQQIPQQSTQMTVQMQQLQQGNPQHLQHIQQIPMGSAQVIQTQNSQQQQYHLPTSQPMMQQGVQSQPNLMTLPQTQYFPNSQMQGTNIGLQPIANSILQTQTQSNPNIAMQQNYPVNPMNQQIGVGHTIPPSSISHLNQTPIPTTTVPVMISQQTSLPGMTNISIPVTQNTVISPQATSQGPTLVQQYVSQPVASSMGPLTQSSGGPQTYASSVLNAVPSNVENIQVYPVEIPAEQSVILSNQLPESFVDGTGEEVQQVEDAER